MLAHQQAGRRHGGQVGQAGQALGRWAGQQLLLRGRPLLLGHAVEQRQRVRKPWPCLRCETTLTHSHPQMTS
jgi:hypothetical protein